MVTCYFVSSSWTSTEQCAGMLICSNSQFFVWAGTMVCSNSQFLCQSSERLQQTELCRWQRICSSACLRHSFWDEYLQISWTTVQALPCLSTCHITVSSSLAIMVISRWPVVDHTKSTMFLLLLWSGREISNLCQHYQSGHHECLCNLHVALVSGCTEHCAGNHETFQIVRNLRQVSWPIPAAAAIATLPTVWEQLACTSVATSWILSSVLTVLGQLICWSSYKLSLPCAKCLCHLEHSPRLLRCTLAWSWEKFC
jgi:hypothetical protein